MRRHHQALVTVLAEGGASDVVAPTCVITCDVSTPTTAATFNYTITFSESVTGFVVGDFSVTNGTKGALGGSGAVYTCAVTPTTAGTPVTANVAAGVAQDAAGNNNLAATELSIDYYIAIYYVNKGGNDTTGDGSQGAPYLTLDKIELAKGTTGGFLVLIGDGVYKEAAIGGALAYWYPRTVYTNRTTWRPENGAAGDVTVQASDAATSYNIRIEGAFRWRIQYLKFRRATNAQPNLLIFRTSASYIEFENCDFTDATTAAVSVMVNGENATTWTPTDISFTDCTFTLTGTSAGECARFLDSSTGSITNVTFTNCTMTSTQAALRIGGVTNAVVVGGTYASGATRPGIQFGEDSAAGAACNGSITGATISSTGNHALLIGAECDNVTVSGCTVTGGDHAIVVKECATTTGIVIDDNTITGGTLSALYLKAGTKVSCDGNAVIITQGYGFQVLYNSTGGNLSGDWVFTNNTINVSGSGKALNIGNDSHDSGGGVCDYNTYKNNSGLGVVRNDAAVANLAELQAAWADYDVTTNDSHSTVT